MVVACTALGATGLNSTESLCDGRSVVSPDSEWVWSTGAGPSPSCSSPAVVNNAQMCEGDPTSIVFQASGSPECLASRMDACVFDMHDLDQLDFDIRMIGCKGTWAAPLWMTPDHWEGGGNSGEIDMLENCPVDKVRSNFAAGGKQVSWTDDGHSVGTGDDFTAHTTMWKQADGNGVMSIHVKTCHPSELKSDGTCPEDGAAYLHDIYGKYGCSRGNCKYHMVSDLWNGVDGDSGWRGCTHRVTNYGSQCRFSVTNIRMKGVTFTGKCAAMMGSPAPSPLPPAPAPAPSKGRCCWGGSSCDAAQNCHVDAFCGANEGQCTGNCAGMWCPQSDEFV